MKGGVLLLILLEVLGSWIVQNRTKVLIFKLKFFELINFVSGWLALTYWSLFISNSLEARLISSKLSHFLCCTLLFVDNSNRLLENQEIRVLKAQFQISENTLSAAMSSGYPITVPVNCQPSSNSNGYPHAEQARVLPNMPNQVGPSGAPIPIAVPIAFPSGYGAQIQTGRDNGQVREVINLNSEYFLNKSSKN